MFLSTKKLVFIFLMIFSLFEAQQKSKDFSHILRSNSIYEIDAYLRVAHPDEPKRSVLKPRLIKLLKEYIQNAHPAARFPWSLDTRMGTNMLRHLALEKNNSHCHPHSSWYKP